MAFNPTEMQKLAIKTRGNVLVSAAAGSGKTAVLVERVATMLTDKQNPVSADKLLIVTFTNAAAAEMRSRIEKRIYDEIQAHPDDEYLQKQKYLLQNADICTIDSFCIRLVRENFEKCGIEPDFKISDESQQTAISKKVVLGVVSKYFENPTPDFEHLLELVNCEFSESELTELVINLHKYSQQMPFPQNFIDGLYSPYKDKFERGNVWYDMALEEAIKKIDSARFNLQKMEQVAHLVGKNVDKHFICVEETQAMLDDFKSTLALQDWNAFYNKLNNTPFPKTPSTAADDAYGKEFKANKKEIKNIVDDLSSVFYAERSIVEKDISKDAPSVKILVDILYEYAQNLFEEFKKENAFTFYNMEQMALSLICEYKDGQIVIREDAKELCNRYDEVLVDEFQDVNNLQDTLFYALSNCEEKLFVVGDMKQSIYGFRGSNPENFLNKKERYIPVESAKESDSKKIILSDNFRSRKGVCDTVNFLFSQLLAGQCGKIIYNEDEYLNAGGKFPESDAPTAEILVIDKFDDDSDDSLIETEANKIADYIYSVMNEGNVITDGDTLRAARYSDFAILLDKIKDKAIDTINVLKKRGIPVALGGDSFMDSIEVSYVMSLLQVIDNPKSDVELLQVMLSPTFAFSTEDLALIRVNKKDESLYSSVLFAAANGDEKCQNFVEKLSQLRRDAAVLSIDRLISKLIHSTDILNTVSALPGGKTRKENLFMLINYAESYVSRSDSGIYGFIKFMKSLPEKAFKNSSSNTENAVRVMTMHNSKGLQFPVCIVANLSLLINVSDSSSRTLFSDRGGIAFKYYSEQLGKDVEMFGHTVMADAARVKTTEEKLRLLYVALTRAIDRLCIVYSAKDLNKKIATLSKNLLDKYPYVSRNFLETNRAMGEWILSCALVHPDGKVLREYAEIDAPVVESDSKIKITIAKADDTTGETETEQTAESVCNDEFAKKIKLNAEFVYPYDKLRTLQAKASVSRLVHAAEDDRFDFSEVPAFMLGDKLSGAARGTAMHHIMQFINMTPEVDVEAEIERLIEWKFITEREAASADLAAIDTFFKSDVYSRIISSDNIHREMRFLTEIPATRIDPTLDLDTDDANIIVQGAVDLCFIEDDGVVVLDFKTDKVDNLDRLVECYGEQLEIYSTAAEKIFGLPVKEKIIYSFHLGKSISF